MLVSILHDQLLREQFENEHDKEPVSAYACVNEAGTVVNDDNSNDDGEVDQAHEDEHDDIVHQDVNEEVVGGDDIQNDDNEDDVENTRKASADVLKLEQQNDKSLSNCWSVVHRGKAGYFIRNGILYRNERILNFEYEQLCLPKSRRDQAIKLAHETFGGHLSAKKTRLKLSFT